MNFLKSMFNPRSAVKALRDIGVGLVGVAVPAGLTYLAQPEAVAPLVNALGPLGILAGPAIGFGVRYLWDAWSHRAQNR